MDDKVLVNEKDSVQNIKLTNNDLKKVYNRWYFTTELSLSLIHI